MCRGTLVGAVVVFAVHRYQRGRHLVQEAPGELGRVRATGLLGRPLRAVQILNERTAHRPDVVFGIPAFRRVMVLKLLLLLLLVMPFVPGLVFMLVMFGMMLLLGDDRNRVVIPPSADLVVGLDPLQAGRVGQELVLVGPFTAQIPHELMGAIIELVEAIPLLQGHATAGVAADALQAAG